MPALGKLAPIVTECKRQFDNCLYTSTSLFEYIKFLQRIRRFTVIVPLVLGGIAGWNVLTAADSYYVKLITASCAFIAGLIPSVMAALKFDDSLDKCRFLANEYKNLQDRFRQAAEIVSHKGIAELEKEFALLRDQMETLRKNSLIVPERFFLSAQKKVDAGHYKFDIDTATIESDQND